MRPAFRPSQLGQNRIGHRRLSAAARFPHGLGSRSAPPSRASCSGPHIARGRPRGPDSPQKRQRWHRICRPHAVSELDGRCRSRAHRARAPCEALAPRMRCAGRTVVGYTRPPRLAMEKREHKTARCGRHSRRSRAPIGTPPEQSVTRLRAQRQRLGRPGASSKGIRVPPRAVDLSIEHSKECTVPPTARSPDRENRPRYRQWPE